MTLMKKILMRIIGAALIAGGLIIISWLVIEFLNADLVSQWKFLGGLAIFFAPLAVLMIMTAALVAISLIFCGIVLWRKAKKK